MGQEISCTATWDGRRSEGRAQLETDYLLFRGDYRLKLPFAEMKKVSARAGRLSIQSTQGKVSIDLGDRAAKWADKILHPPSVLDKLGVKADLRVSVIGGPGTSFSKDLEARVGAPVSKRQRKDSHLIFLFADDPAVVGRVRSLRSFLVPNGAIWIVYPKGKKALTENGVLEAGRDAGLKDVKVAKFSDTHTALKFVIPVSDR
ncbi:MAG: hypothetical protein QOH90_1764 [Actinomycetota bacterium]|nr:hypothetical protein [Actinomycetota bacterium]